MEGGNIDTAHHESKAKHAFEEVIQFDNAIAAAVKTVGLEETLVIVTADHSHGVTINGYSSRDKSVLGEYQKCSQFEDTTYKTRPVLTSRINFSKAKPRPTAPRRSAMRTQLTR